MEPAPSLLESIPKLEQDIPAEAFDVYSHWPLIGSILAILFILAIIAYLIWHKKRPVVIPEPSPLETAMRALLILDNSTLSLRECSLRLSMILRTFLAGQSMDTALFETHEEFSRRMDSLSGVPVSCREETRELLDELVEFKYAGSGSADALKVSEMVERTRNLVNHIAEAQAAQAAASPKPQA